MEAVAVAVEEAARRKAAGDMEEEEGEGEEEQRLWPASRPAPMCLWRFRNPMSQM